MNKTDIYQLCANKTINEGSENATHILLQCVVNSLQNENRSLAIGVDTFFLIFAASLVFFMQAGFAMVCAGCVRLKNVQNTMLKNLLDACGAAITFYCFGFAFAFGGDDNESKTFIGNTKFFLSGVDPIEKRGYIYFMFQYAFAATCCTIVAGTLAERCQMSAYLYYSILFSGFVYPVIAHSIWSENGFISAYATDPLWGSGMIDFAGSGVVHASAGLTAFYATYVLGPRHGRFFDSRGRKLDKPKNIPGHSIPLQMLGTFILWFCWYGFNTGSALFISNEERSRVTALTAINTTLAAASGALASLILNFILTDRATGEGEYSTVRCMNGALAGLVSITGGCATIEPWAAIITGSIAGCLYVIFSNFLVRKCIDDAVDAIPVHMVNGIWGLISVGLFTTPKNLQQAYGFSKHAGLFYSWNDATLLACQLCGILFIVGWISVIFFPFFLLLNYLGVFRSDSLTEVVGLDLNYHVKRGESLSDTSDEIKPEHLEAFRKRQNNMTRGKMKPLSNTSENGEFLFGEEGVDNVVSAS